MSHQCGKCSSDMEEGFVVDQAESTYSLEKWVAGNPEKNWLTGISLKGKVVYEVRTLRCVSCGFLESYALKKL
jgi:hypothetical protein